MKKKTFWYFRHRCDHGARVRVKIENKKCFLWNHVETRAVMWLSCSSTLLSGWFRRQTSSPSPCLSVVRLRRNSERPSASPSCWLPWKRSASQPASRRRYGMFWLVFTIWELQEPAEVTLIHHHHSHCVCKNLYMLVLPYFWSTRWEITNNFISILSIVV